MKLRDYQQEILADLLASESNDLVQLETGAGKTPIEVSLAIESDFFILVAHRNILITQISAKLAEFGFRHNTVSTEYTRRRCMLAHQHTGSNYIDRNNSHHLVASIDSLLAQYDRGYLEIDTTKNWLIVIDEAHHVTTENKWGRIAGIFPNARIVGFTATPARNDGESLGVKNGGLFERLVQSKDLTEDSTKKLIERGFLSDFKSYSPKEVLKSAELAMSPINAYKQWAKNTQAIMFSPSILNAEEFAEEFIEQGVSAAVISSKMSGNDVSKAIDAFRLGQIKVLINVDMISEGFDMPAVETLILASFTKSFIRYKQWIGRALRVMKGKRYASIIDLCGNIIEHGQPDDPVIWDIDSPPKGMDRKRESPCFECGFYYQIKLRFCPECKAENELHNRQAIGGHYVNIKYLDMQLVHRAVRLHKSQEQDEKLDSEIVWPSESKKTDAVSRACYRIRDWFVSELVEHGYEYRAINNFLSSRQAQPGAFWSSNFTLADIDKNKSKAIKVMKSWQKSQQ